MPVGGEAQSPVYYIDNEELQTFAASDSTSCEGVSYTWEGEQVSHLRFRPVRHGFGRQGTVLFTRQADGSAEGYDFTVVVAGDGAPLVFAAGMASPVEAMLIPARAELFSRSKGILEVGALADRRVMIVGLGSFGSQIAVELAKAGVGHFAIMDFDRVEIHNLARHTCGLNELGRLKTDAIYDAILGKNPYAEVERFPININRYPELMEQQCRRADLVICATDNNESRFKLSKTLVATGRTGIFGRAVTRAEGGDVFIYRPGQACYCCLIGNDWFGQSDEEISNEASARRDGRIASYMSAEDAEAVVQVGLSSDIEPITNMMVKLSLMELSRGLDTGISALEEELVYNYYMWANRRERRHANWSAMPSAGAMPTILRWYGARIQRDEECSLCNARSHAGLDLGDAADLELLERIGRLNAELGND